MNNEKQNHFGIRLLIPVILTITAFVVSIYVIFIPTLQNNLIREKKEMIRELTQSAVSILKEFHAEEANGKYQREEAQNIALKIIGGLRYGEESKDYFWVTDLKPVMIIHPFRLDLIGKKLDNYEDPNGKKLFLESVALVKEYGEGYLDYFWQWKDDSTLIVPKLSYVEEFKPWGYIVGTGIYLNDVQNEISRLKTRLALVALGIILFVAGILYYFLRTSLQVERKRKQAEEALQDSRERYRSLVEASREGTILSIDGKITYVNPTFLEKFGYLKEELINQPPEKLFNNQAGDEDNGLQAFREFIRSDSGFIQFETNWPSRENPTMPVMLAISRISMGDKKGCIFIVKELSSQELMSQKIEELGEELQTSLLFMNQPVNLISRSPLSCTLDTPIQKCAELMSRHNQDAIIIHGPKEEFLGIITDQDLRNRALATNIDNSKPAYLIMTSPLVTISQNALLFEALISLQENNVTHIGTTDQSGSLIGLISNEELLHVQQNTTAFLMKLIRRAQHPDELIEHSQKTSSLVKVLAESGAKTRNITRIITAITDALTHRFIQLAIESLGQPPASFAFISVGSEGRGEQTLATDQDNAIIYQDVLPERENAVSAYFIKVGKLVNDWLHEAGYQYCKGDIMAGNQRWCQSLSKWKTDFKNWVIETSPQAAVAASIFFDFRIVLGNKKLSAELQEYVLNITRNKNIFSYHLAQEALRFKAAHNLSSALTEKLSSGEKAFDIKNTIYPITCFARLYCLTNGISAKNTFSRLSELEQKGLITTSFFNQLSDSYDFLMMLRFRSQIRAIERNESPDNLVAKTTLSDHELNQLKKVFASVGMVQTKMKLDFNQ